jgi:protein gp37
MAKRLQAMGQARYSKGFNLTVHYDLLHQPELWKKPCTIFVNSMSDLFHQAVPIEFISQVFATMARTPWHTYQILTKRADRLKQVALHLKWSQNIWIGVTVESQEYVQRINLLQCIPASVRFISFEPLLGPIHYTQFEEINWVIVGGESGPRARPMLPEWVRDIRNSCTDRNIPFFFKQWGGINKKRNGRLLDGRTWNEYPRLF